LGILHLTSAVAARSGLQAAQRQWVVMLGEAVKLSLSNLKLREKLREQATRDLLTGTFNRRYLDETLPRELSRAQRQRAPLCIAMLDIDHFKKYNDTFGHGPGDSLLRELGRMLREHLREGDIVCRYGGDEFVLVLPDSSAADTLRRVEEVRVLVGQLRVQDSKQLLGTITFSAGIAQASEREANAGELLRAADQALYAAQQSGRDRIVVHGAQP
jgi:diguanylate cyclase (GGDEF)-like protein